MHGNCTKSKGDFCTHINAEIMQEVNPRCNQQECEFHTAYCLKPVPQEAGWVSIQVIRYLELLELERRMDYLEQFGVQYWESYKLAMEAYKLNGR